MRRFNPEFKDDKDRLITLAMLIASMFFIFVPSLVVIFIPKNYISETTYEVAKTLFNFELLLFLISLLFVIPIIGWIVGFIVAPILMIWRRSPYGRLPTVTFSMPMVWTPSVADAIFQTTMPVQLTTL